MPAFTQAHVGMTWLLDRWRIPFTYCRLAKGQPIAGANLPYPTKWEHFRVVNDIFSLISFKSLQYFKIFVFLQTEKTVEIITNKINEYKRTSINAKVKRKDKFNNNKMKQNE